MTYYIISDDYILDFAKVEVKVEVDVGAEK